MVVMSSSGGTLERGVSIQYYYGRLCIEWGMNRLKHYKARSIKEEEYTLNKVDIKWTCKCVSYLARETGANSREFNEVERSRRWTESKKPRQHWGKPNLVTEEDPFNWGETVLKVHRGDAMFISVKSNMGRTDEEENSYVHSQGFCFSKPVQ